MLRYPAETGEVSASRVISQVIAASRFVEHISIDGFRLLQTAGRNAEPKRLHKLSSDNWTHRTFAGFPCGMPGIGLEIDGAIQQAPQSGRQFITVSPESLAAHLITFSQNPRIPLA
jgi:hypothetical protein